MLSPGDAGNNDRFIMQDIIKEMASNRNIAAIAGGGEKKASGAQFKTVVLMEVDRLSRQAQAALRRTMEKYASSCRLILCCNSQSKVIEPVRSRCLGIRVGAPTEDEVSLIYLTLLSGSFVRLASVSYPVYLIFFATDLHRPQDRCYETGHYFAG
jgi:DNA polymerase III delta prime subunit